MRELTIKLNFPYIRRMNKLQISEKVTLTPLQIRVLLAIYFADEILGEQEALTATLSELFKQAYSITEKNMTLLIEVVDSLIETQMLSQRRFNGNLYTQLLRNITIHENLIDLIKAENYVGFDVKTQNKVIKYFERYNKELPSLEHIVSANNSNMINIENEHLMQIAKEQQVENIEYYKNKIFER